MEIWDLDSRSLHSIPSVNTYEQKIKQVIETVPFWEKDGGGIRGRTIAPLISGASGPNLMGDPLPQQFNQQRSGLIQQQDDPLPTLSLPSSGGTSEGIIHPWKISLRTVPESDPPEYQFRVELNSKLYSGFGSWDSIEIIDLNVWKDISNQGSVILFGVVAGGVCTEASIQGPQDTISDRIDSVDGEQSSFAVQLGYIYQDDDAFFAEQAVFQNLTLINICVNGSPAIYPIST